MLGARGAADASHRTPCRVHDRRDDQPTGAIAAALAVPRGSFMAFCSATFVMGAGGAFVQQYRFAAAESVDPRHAGRAVSFVLVGGMIAGALGPELGRRGRLLFERRIQRRIRPHRDRSGRGDPAAHGASRAAAISRRRPLRAAACACRGAAASGLPSRSHSRRARRSYAVMSFIMTATPISMHVMDGHSLEDTATVLQSHVMAMYAPSLVTGLLVDRLGVRRMMLAGTLALLACPLTTAFSHTVAAYWTGLVLLGFGWNLLFVGGTVLLTQSYQPAERFRAQATNDLAVFGSQASASFASGAALHRFGWTTMNLTAVPILIGMLALIGWLGGRVFPRAGTGARQEPGAEPPV